MPDRFRLKNFLLHWPLREALRAEACADRLQQSSDNIYNIERTAP